MHIELRDAMSARHVLFLFAHQDDEFAIFGEIKREIGCADSVRCVYMTDGGARPDLVRRRNAETLGVLGDLGVCPSKVDFLGGREGIRDGALHAGAVAAASALASSPWIETIDRVYVPAWEGGHQDHDAVHLIGVALALERGAEMRQFSLYHGEGLRGPWFRVFSPLEKNGRVTRHRLPLMDRVRYGLWPMRYLSQWRSFLGLWPFAFVKLLFGSAYATQSVDPLRIFERPHEGELLYERRTHLRYDGFCTATSLIRDRISWLLQHNSV